MSRGRSWPTKSGWARPSRPVCSSPKNGPSGSVASGHRARQPAQAVGPGTGRQILLAIGHSGEPNLQRVGPRRQPESVSPGRHRHLFLPVCQEDGALHSADRWDLVVIDEAHRLRNVYKPTNKIANAIKQAIAPFRKVLLTATPLQNSLLELYGLGQHHRRFRLRRPEKLPGAVHRLANEDDFNDLKERLRPICKRTLRRQVLQYVKFTNRHAFVQEFVPTPEENSDSTIWSRNTSSSRRFTPCRPASVP